MKQIFLSIALLLTVLSFAGTSGPSAKAESGCVLSGYTSMGVPISQAGGSFSCGSDTGSRYIQVCLLKYSTATACTSALHYTGSSGSAIARDYTCYGTGDIYGFHAWVWLYGEDGSTQTWISPNQNAYVNC